jgi:hypothetical protein
MRRTFSAEMLPVIRQRVQQVADCFPGHRDIITVAPPQVEICRSHNSRGDEMLRTASPKR